MKNNTRALLIATLSALVGLVLLCVYKQRFEEAASGGLPVAVVVALEDLPLGTAVTQEQLGRRNIPSSYVEERHIRTTDVERIIGVRLSVAVRRNEPLLWTDLAINNDQRRDLASLVRHGMRALTIRADVTSAFGGLLRPGDRVDVLLTAQREETNKRVTLSLLQNVLVLAVGVDTGTPDPSSRGQTRRAHRQNEVTLSVTVEQAQLVTHARETGELTLALRNPDDVALVTSLPETSNEDIIEPERRAAVSQHEPPVQHRQRLTPSDILDLAKAQSMEERPHVPQRIR